MPAVPAVELRICAYALGCGACLSVLRAAGPPSRGQVHMWWSHHRAPRFESWVLEDSAGGARVLVSPVIAPPVVPGGFT